MSDGEPIVYSVKEWMVLIEKGEVQIPDFQREFVWDRKKVVTLIEAILKERPVGSLLGLNVEKRKGRNVPFQPRAILNADMPEDAKCKILILDGQQRLTALWHALKNKSSHYLYFFKYPGDEEEDSIMGHAVIKPTDGRATWVTDEKRCIEEGFIPIHLVAESSSKRWEWIKKAYMDEEGKANLEEIGELQNWIADIGERILSFKIPYLPLPDKISDLEAIDAFIESNTSSQQLKKFDITVATMHRKKAEDLRNLRDETIENIPEITNYVDEDELGDMLIKIACLREDLSPTKSNYLRNKVLDQIIQNIKEIRSGIKWACDILDENYIFSSRYLPSRVPLRVLPALYKALPSNEADRDVCEKLARIYLWRAFFTSRYTSDAAHLLLSDYRGLRNAFGDKKKQMQIDILDEKKYPLPSSEDLQNDLGWPKNKGTLPRAILTLSFIKGARDLRSNEKINSKNIGMCDAHHIFPRKYLKEQAKVEDGGNTALNCMLIKPKTNQRASSKPPLEYLGDLYSGKDLRAEIGEVDIRKRLASHLIPAELLLQENVEDVGKHYDDFKRERAELMVPIIRKLADGESPD